MQTELMLTEREPLPAVQSTNPMAILDAAVRSGRPVAELSQLMDLAERYERNCAAAAYNAAVARFQSVCPVVFKSRTAKSSGKFEGYQYASYDDVMAAAKPHLDACGLSVSYSYEPSDKGIRTTCTVSHGSHSKDHFSVIPIPSGLSINDTQKYGAAMRYAQRYALCSALNIVVSDEDTDAGGLCELITEKQAERIQALMMETNSDTARFLKWAGVDSIRELTVAKYKDALTMLEAKPRA